MKNPVRLFLISVISLFLTPELFGQTQETSPYRKTAVSFNLTRYAVSELNMSIERFLSPRRSLEFNGGIIYANSFLEDKVKDWNDSPIFSEQGFAGRIHYKIFKRPEPDTRWRDYIAFGIVYRHLYYNDLFVETIEKTDNNNRRYIENFLQDRVRDKYGVEFLWGKVYEITNFLGLEFYYGAGINVTSSTRTDHSRQAIYVLPQDLWRNTTIPTFVDESFYIRPSIQLGAKLRFRF